MSRARRMRASRPRLAIGFAVAVGVAVTAAACGEDTTADIDSAGADTEADAQSTDAEADEETTAAELPGCQNAGTEGATSRCLAPNRTPEYYVDEALKYFDTLDVDADRDRVPAYSELVARWEWPPWLLLTGYGRDDLIDTNAALLTGDPSTVPIRDCRFFEVQPFARCYISFEYDEGPCPIYEEFTFNADGETTFIEAWSDLPGMRLTEDPEDRWAEAEGLPRLSARVPGLGQPSGRIDLDSEWMTAAAATDPDVEDFVYRARDWWKAWFALLGKVDPDFFAQGCGWPTDGEEER